MKKIIIVDARESFLADIHTRMVLDDEREIEIVTTLVSTKNLHTAVNRFKADMIAVCDNLADTQQDWKFDGVQVVGYALSAEGETELENRGIPSYGVVGNVAVLLDKLQQGLPQTKKVMPKETSDEQPEKSPDLHREKQHMEDKDETPVSRGNEKVKQNTDSEKTNPVYSKEEKKPVTAEKHNAVKTKIRLYKDNENKGRMADMLAEKESKPVKKKTTTVSYYSAKGGVGTTTLAVETASCLALTSVGRGLLKVCIVDFDIDFGDVLTTLNCNADKATMTQWAEDIRRRLARGHKKITYSRNEIDKYIQINESTGLHALLAPLTHEESMSIGEAELEIMLDNLIRFSGFDYIVCDTGSNTRDAAMIALEKSDYVFNILTQDVNAANCNDLFLMTMKKVNFNLEKVKLIINRVLPAKITGVSSGEVESLFQHECIARVRYDASVMRAVNYSKPLVLDGGNETTKEIRRIISFLTGINEETLKPKKGFFKKYFKK